MASDSATCESFWLASPEKGELNQYWYSQASIDVLVEQVLKHGPRAALVSCPSVYFSLPPDSRACCKVLEFDRVWEKDPGFVFYDFNDPEAIPAELHHYFDLAVVDPPYITKEVWSKYAITTRLLLKQGADDRGVPLGRLLCTSIAENAPMLNELLGIEPRRFRPSIPNLVYQYHTYTNYESARLMQHNVEVDPDGDVPMPSFIANPGAAAAWEATYGTASGRPDELGIRSSGDANEKPMAVLPAFSFEAEREDEATDFGPAVAAVMALRGRLGELKKGIAGLDLLLQALVQKADRFAKLKENPHPHMTEWSARRAAVDKAIADRDAALDCISLLATAIDEADAELAKTTVGTSSSARARIAGDLREPSYVEVSRSICDGAVAIQPYTPRSGRKDVVAFSAGTKQHVQRIFKHQTALLALMKELKSEFSVSASGDAQA
mmetsp:Transcript_49922/g.139769  ORF Transcript_49922/g.139769 Transcript_49922/m.139769 type:complete len:438 (+) Transcript_49922:50-1363(+)